MAGAKTLRNPLIPGTVAGALATAGTAWLAGMCALMLVVQLEHERAPIVPTWESDRLGMRLAVSVEPGPVVVVEARAGTPAERGGLRSGDVIVVVQDQIVESVPQVARLISTLPQEGTLSVEVRRGNGYEVLAIPIN